jgi:hypothetical protein
MPRISGLLAVLSLLVMVPAGLSAQGGSAPTKKALAREVLQLTRAAEQALTVMEKAVEGQRGMNPEIPGVFWDRFLERAKEQKSELLDMLMEVGERWGAQLGGEVGEELQKEGVKLN